MKFTIHEKVGCPFCEKAIILLDSHNIDYHVETYDPNVEGYEEAKQRLFNYTGKNKFPQIFKGNTLIGGYDDLNEYFKYSK